MFSIIRCISVIHGKVFVTYGEPPGSSPSDLRAAALSSTSVRLSWTPIRRAAWHSGLIGYHLGFRHDK